MIINFSVQDTKVFQKCKVFFVMPSQGELAYQFGRGTIQQGACLPSLLSSPHFPLPNADAVGMKVKGRGPPLRSAPPRAEPAVLSALVAASRSGHQPPGVRGWRTTGQPTPPHRWLYDPSSVALTNGDSWGFASPRPASPSPRHR